jgi:transcriptional regulator with XRE-family HTH domain
VISYSGGVVRFERSQLRFLGHKIRSIREARGWSLRRLSSISGVSVAAVQKIEAGTVSPSLLSVVAIVDALGASLDQLISVSRAPDKTVTVVRGGAPARVPADVDLSADLDQAKMACRLVVLDGGREREDISATDALFGYVLGGGLRLSFADQESATLSTGDSFHVAANTSTRWGNPQSRRSVVLCITAAESASGNSRSGTGK